jgi:hypothetical protein
VWGVPGGTVISNFTCCLCVFLFRSPTKTDQTDPVLNFWLPCDVRALDAAEATIGLGVSRATPILYVSLHWADVDDQTLWPPALTLNLAA